MCVCVRVCVLCLRADRRAHSVWLFVLFVWPDPLFLHVRLRRRLRRHQDLAPLVLRPHLPRQRPGLQDVAGLWLLPVRLVPHHQLGDHGELLQARLALLEPVWRRRRVVHRHQALLRRHRHHQHAQRRRHPVDPHPADPQAADVGEEEGSRHRNPVARRLVCVDYSLSLSLSLSLSNSGMSSASASRA